MESIYKFAKSLKEPYGKRIKILLSSDKYTLIVKYDGFLINFFGEEQLYRYTTSIHFVETSINGDEMFIVHHTDTLQTLKKLHTAEAIQSLNREIMNVMK